MTGDYDLDCENKRPFKSRGDSILDEAISFSAWEDSVSFVTLHAYIVIIIYNI